MSGDLSTLPFDWDNMITSYTGSYTTEQGEAVSKLMYACGLAVNASYRSTTTNAKTIKCVSALCDNFGYSKDICYWYRNYIPSTEEWENLVYGSLENKRPVIYRGGSDNGGHCFICDGYKDGLFHINWGWGGTSDGYFSLDTLNPSEQGDGSSEGGYNQSQQIITNIHPPVEGETNQYQQPGIVGYTGDFSYGECTKNGTTRTDRFFADNNGTVTGFYNKSPFPLTFKKGILAIDREGKQTPVLQGDDDIYTYEYNKGSWNYSVEGLGDIPEGSYTIYPVFQIQGEEDIVRKMQPDEGYRDHLYMTVHGDGTFEISETTDIIAELVVTAFNVIGPAYTGETRNVEITVTNLDKFLDYDGEIIADITNEAGESVKQITFSAQVASGQTATFTQSVDFTDLEGNYIVSFLYPSGVQISNITFQLEVTKGEADSDNGKSLKLSQCPLESVYKPHTEPQALTVTLKNGSTNTNSKVTVYQLNVGIYNVNNTDEPIYEFDVLVNKSISYNKTLDVTLTPNMTQEALDKFVRGDYFIRLKNKTGADKEFYWFTTRHYFKAEYTVDNVTLDNEALTLKTGRSESLTATMNPTPNLVEGEEFPLNWSSTDSQVAEVDANGKVTGVAEGETDIYAMAPTGPYAICHVTVEKENPDDPVAELAVTAFNVIGPAYPGVTRDVEISVTNLDKELDYYGNIIAKITNEAGETVKQITFNDKVAAGQSVTITQSVDFTDVPEGNYTVSFYYPSGAQMSNMTFNLEVTLGMEQYGSEDLTLMQCQLNSVYEPHKNMNPIVVTVKNTSGKEMTVSQLRVCLFNVNNTDESIYDFNTDVDKTLAAYAATTVTLTPEMTGDALAKFVRGDYYIRLRFNTGTTKDKSFTYFTGRQYFKVEYPVENVTMDNEALTLKTGRSESLTATMNPTPKLVEGEEFPMNWSSTDSQVAEVDANGKVTGIAEGETDIYAMAPTGPYAICHVTVEKENPDDPVAELVVTAFNVIGPAYTGVTRNVEISVTNLDQEMYYYGNIIADIKDEAGETVKQITFNDKVDAGQSVTITQSIDFTDVPVGNYTVSFYYPSGAQMSNVTFNFEVIKGEEDTESTDLKLIDFPLNSVYEPHENPASINVTVKNNTDTGLTIYQLRASLFNVNNTDAIYDFNSEVVKKNLGAYATTTIALTPDMTEEDLDKFVRGDYYIKLQYKTSSDGEFIVFSTGHYFKAEYTVNTVTLNAESITLKTGKTESLTATMDPDPTDKLVEGEEFPLTWSSTDPNVAEVDTDGHVTGVSEGEADVYAMAPTGTYATCHVKVEKALQTSVEEIFSNDGLKLVGVKDGFKVIGVTGKTFVSVHATTGMQVMPTMEVSEDVKVSTDALATGMYIVTAETDGKTVHLKLIKH